MPSLYAQVLHCIIADYPCTKLHLKQMVPCSMTAVIHAVDYWQRRGLVRCDLIQSPMGGKPRSAIAPTLRPIMGQVAADSGQGAWVASIRLVTPHTIRLYYVHHGWLVWRTLSIPHRMHRPHLPKVYAMYQSSPGHAPMYAVMMPHLSLRPMTLDWDQMMAYAAGDCGIALCNNPVHAAVATQGTVHSIDLADLPSSYIANGHRLTLQQCMDNPAIMDGALTELRDLLTRFWPNRRILCAWAPSCWSAAQKRKFEAIIRAKAALYELLK